MQNNSSKNQEKFKYERPTTMGGFLADFWWTIFPVGGFIVWAIKQFVH